MIIQSPVCNAQNYKGGQQQFSVNTSAVIKLWSSLQLQRKCCMVNARAAVNVLVNVAGAGIALYGEEGAHGQNYQAHIQSYDYDCMVSEAGQYGQPGIGGPNKYEVIQFRGLAKRLVMPCL